jgi:hypothetical protein
VVPSKNTPTSIDPSLTLSPEKITLVSVHCTHVV